MNIRILRKFISFNNKNKNFNSYLNFFSFFISILSIIFVVLIISVNSGFKNSVERLIIDLNGKYKVSKKYNQKLTDDDYNSIKSSRDLQISKINELDLIAKNKRVSEPVNIISFSNTKNFINKIDNYLISGSLSDDKIIIGNILAKKLNVDVGQRLTFLQLSNDNIENIDVLTIGGIFKTNIPSFDKHRVYGNSILFNNFKSSNYDYFITNNNLVENLDDKNYYIQNIFDLNINFFKWLNTYDAPINLLVFFILVICIFNILQNNFLYVSNHKKEFFLLKTLGLKNSFIFSVISIRSLIILFTSSFVGFSLSYAMLFLEMKFKIITLPEYVYFTDSLPVEINLLLPLYVVPLSIFIIFSISIYFYNIIIKRYEF